MRILVMICIVVGLTGGLCASCQKEAALSPSPAQEEFYQLPQGDQSYDQIFMGFYQQYGTYFLYRFTDNDFQWNGVSRLSYVAREGETEHIQAAYDFMNKAFLSDYTVENLRKLLPFKILLSAGIHQLRANVAAPTGYDTLAANVGVMSTINQVTFGYANQDLETLSSVQKTELQAAVHKIFFTYALAREKVSIPPAFAELFVSTGNSSSAYKSLGYLEYKSGYTVSLDFLMYIYAALRYNEEQFTANYLTAAYDTSGRVAQKYAIIRHYLNDVWGIDSEGIANRVW